MSVRICSDCGLSLQMVTLRVGQEAICPRCSALIQTAKWQWRTVFALWFSGILFWVASLLQPLISITINGQEQSIIWWQLAGVMWQNDALLLSLVISITTIVAPSIYFLLLAWILFPRMLRIPHAWSSVLWRWLAWSRSGLMLEVFFLGVLVSAVKLSDTVQVIPNWSLVAFIGLMLVVSALSVVFDVRKHTAHPTHSMLSVPQLSLIWAVLLSAWILYIPANLLPMMVVTSLGKTSSDTIMDGVVHFIQAEQWSLALVIFIASIVVPITKLLVLMGLLLSVQFKWCQSLIVKTKAHRLIKFIGVWSMVDIFVITLLVALVQFGEFAQVQAGSGALAFLLVVILTILATHLFQSRWLWMTCQHSCDQE